MKTADRNGTAAKRTKRTKLGTFARGTAPGPGRPRGSGVTGDVAGDGGQGSSVARGRPGTPGGAEASREAFDRTSRRLFKLVSRLAARAAAALNELDAGELDPDGAKATASLLTAAVNALRQAGVELERQAKLAGLLQGPGVAVQINLADSAEWRRLLPALYAASAPWPDSQRAMAEAVRRLLPGPGEGLSIPRPSGDPGGPGTLENGGGSSGEVAQSHVLPGGGR